MKKAFVVLAIAGILTFAAIAPAFAADRVRLHADYNSPVGTATVEPNVEFGASYQFWGIFFFNGSIYTDIVTGGTNILGIEAIHPIGLFSLGGGMRIPLGGFGLLLDWERFYTGAWSGTGVNDFADSYRIGLDIELSHTLSVEVFSRTLYGFTGASSSGGAFAVPASDKISMIGAGVVLHLF